MPLLKQSIPNLIGGISQQPWHLRLPGQSQDEENTLGSPVNGLMKRPPAIFSGQLNATLSTNNVYVETIRAQDTSAYLIIQMNGNYGIYAMNGDKLKEGYAEYLDNSDVIDTYNALQAYRTSTMGGKTYVLNRLKTVTWNGLTTDTGLQGTLIWVRLSDYNTTFTVNDSDGNTVAQYTTPDSWVLPENHSDPEQVSKQRALDTEPETVAGKLHNDLLSNGYADAEVYQNGAVLIVEGHNLFVKGGSSVNSFIAVRERAQSFEDLPRTAIQPFKCSIVRNPSEPEQGYWVVYRDPWMECGKPDTYYELEKNTMPHLITHGSSFDPSVLTGVEPIIWPDKPVGDDSDEFVPSFINRKINDIFFHRDRLGFIAEDFVILSRIGDYHNFWRTTASQVLEDDPIDVSSTHTKGNQLLYALPYHQDLYLFSEAAQYILVGSNVLSPYTVAITQSATFPFLSYVNPIGVGQHVFFLSSRQEHTMVREYVIPGNQLAHKAPEITGHVPSLIPKTPTEFVGSVNENMLAIKTQEEPNRLYIYKYYEQDGELLQRSWNYWSFGSELSKILKVDFNSSKMDILITDDYTKAVGDWNLYTLSIPIETMWSRAEENIPVHLDWRVHWIPGDTQASTCSLVYDSANNETTVTTPYPIPYDRIVGVVTQPGENSNRAEGERLYADVSDSDSYKAIAYGDLTNDYVYFGYPYIMRYVMTTPTLRESDSNSRIMQQRVQLRKVSFSFFNSGPFSVHVTATGYRSHYGSDAYFGGKPYGSYDPSELYPRIISEGTRDIPVRAQDKHANIEVQSDHWAPLNLTGATFEAWVYGRAERV